MGQRLLRGLKNAESERQDFALRPGDDMDVQNSGIPKSWDALRPLSESEHDPKFLGILREHGLSELKSPIPLLGRYTRGRRWTFQEFEECYRAWRSGVSLTLVAGALNRNPQDMIYKLLGRCKAEGLKFSEKGRSEGSSRWTSDVAKCAAKLFEAGLPAWKIAVLFRVDFEHVEKAVFMGRPDYGHQKKNPFAICTDHKHLVNAKVLRSSRVNVEDALDAFAGEGRFTRLVEEIYPTAAIIAVEADTRTFLKVKREAWGPRTRWFNGDNLEVFKELQAVGCKFDLIDLDPFVTCHEQVKVVWPLLKSQALLFITLGGEYRRSFIGSNRKAIAVRYGFQDFKLDNQTYLEVVPSSFLGSVAGRASQNGFVMELIRAIRYPNTCRFWTKVTHVGEKRAKVWLDRISVEQAGGRIWSDLDIPRFRKVRWELKVVQQGGLFS